MIVIEMVMEIVILIVEVVVIAMVIVIVIVIVIVSRVRTVTAAMPRTVRLSSCAMRYHMVRSAWRCRLAVRPSSGRAEGRMDRTATVSSDGICGNVMWCDVLCCAARWA